METHEDSQHGHEISQSFMERLQMRAEAVKKAGASKITGGAEHEHPLGEWEAKGFSVRQMPDDEQGILRISIGGGQTPVPLNYLVFRGKHQDCIDLLRKALQALYEIDKVKCIDK